MANEKTIKLSFILEGDIAEKFLDIKERKGLKKNPEVIRLIISEYPEV